MVDTAKIFTNIPSDCDLDAVRTIIDQKGSQYQNVQQILKKADPCVTVVMSQKGPRLYIIDTVGRALRGTNTILPASVDEVLKGLEAMRDEACQLTGLDLPPILEWKLSRFDLATQWQVDTPDSVIRSIHHSLTCKRSDEVSLHLDRDGASLSSGNRKSRLWRLYDKDRQRSQTLKKKSDDEPALSSERCLRFEVSYSGYALRKLLGAGASVRDLITFLNGDAECHLQTEWAKLTELVGSMSIEEVANRLRNLSGQKQLQTLEAWTTINVMGLERYKQATNASRDTIRRRLQSIHDAGLQLSVDPMPFPPRLRKIAFGEGSYMDP